MTPYTTKQGDRWDLIAWKAYGDTSRLKDIIAANPTVPIWAVLPAGLQMQIPVISQAELDTTNLPPWKR